MFKNERYRTACTIGLVIGGLALLGALVVGAPYAINSAQDREAMERCTDRRVMAGISLTDAAPGCRHLIDMLHNEFGESSSAVRDIINELNKLPSSLMGSQESIARLGEALKAR